MIHNYRLSLDITKRPTIDEALGNILHGGLKVYNMKSEKEYSWFPSTEDGVCKIEVLHYSDGEIWSNILEFKSVKELRKYIKSETDENDWWYGYFED